VKILRGVLLLFLFVFGVWVGIENQADVQFAYLPAIPLVGLGAASTITMPVFLLVLLAVLIGGVCTGGLALFQQSSLKFQLRRAIKDRDRIAGDEAAVREKLELVTAQLDQARREAAELRVPAQPPAKRPASEEAEEDDPAQAEPAGPTAAIAHESAPDEVPDTAVDAGSETTDRRDG